MLELLRQLETTHKEHTMKKTLLPAALALAAPFAATAGLLYETGNYAAQTNLVLHLDGIRNAGALKAHNSDAATWVDLVRGNSASFYPITTTTGTTGEIGVSGWTDDGYYFNGLTYGQMSGTLSLATSNITVQVVCDVDTDTAISRYNENKNTTLTWPHLIGTSTSGDLLNFFYDVKNNLLKFKAKGTCDAGLSNWDGKFANNIIDKGQQTISDFSSTGDTKAHKATALNAKNITIGAASGSGNYPYFQRSLVGTIKAVRIYNRVLTAAELSANRVIDEARYFGGIPTTNVVVMTAVAGAEGREASGAYAIDSEGYVFSAPHGVVVNGTYYKCTGYTLETWDGSAWSSAASIRSRTYAATDTSAKVRITWQWTAGVKDSALDDAVFKLDLRGDLNANSFIDRGEAGNAIAFSGPSPADAVYGASSACSLTPENYSYDTWGTLPSIAATEVVNPYYSTASTENVLVLPQDSQTVDGTTYWAYNGLWLDGGAVPPGGDGCATIYARFRWDGSTTSPNLLVGNGWNGTFNSANGHSVYLDASGNIGVVVSNEMSKSSIAVPADTWCDLFVTTRNEEVNGVLKAVSEIYLCTNRPSSKPLVISGSCTGGTAMHWTPKNTGLTIGNYLTRPERWTTGDTSRMEHPRSFKGIIADVVIWDRALTEAERIEVMAGHHGAKWRIGAANGSSDEFNDGTGDISIADPYLPESLPWNRMRKTLDAASPTLTLKSPLAAHEAGKPIILTVSPIASGTASAAPASVSVNGTLAGTLDLATGTRSLVIPKSLWQRDGDGNVTVALTRTDTLGAVAIDAIALSGSWQSETADGAYSGTGEKSAAPWAFAGDCDTSHFTSSTSVGNASTNYTFGVWVPDGMGEKCGWTFRTRIASRGNSYDHPEAYAVLVNGATVATRAGKFTVGESFTATIPEGVLHDGMNTVQWVQTAPTRAEQLAVEGKPGVFQFYDYWAMTLVPPPSAFVLTVR